MSQAVPDYLNWFGFKEPPFRLSPDLDFFYPARPHREVLKVLEYAISRGEGFMVLSGPAGTGKTLLLRLLMNELPPEKKTAFIVTPSVSPKGLLLLLLEELDIPVSNEDSELAILLKKFQDALLTLASKKEKLLIILDEAQDLPMETVEQLRLLSNIETNKEKLLQILLVGQPELQNLLDDPRLCQLTQRIVVNEKLRPLSQKETKEFIHFRLSRAGRGDLEISKQFLSKLYEYTGGLPRLINRLMDRTLLMAATHGHNILSPRDLNAAISTLPEPKGYYNPKPPSEKKHLNTQKVYICTTLTALAVIIALFLAAFKYDLLKVPNIKKSHKTLQEKPKEAPVHPITIPASLTSTPPTEKREQSEFFVTIYKKRALIFSKPLKNSSILTIAKRGDKFLVLDETDKWFLIELSAPENGNENEKIGWIPKTSVKRINSADITFWQNKLDSRPRQGDTGVQLPMSKP